MSSVPKPLPTRGTPLGFALRGNLERGQVVTPSLHRLARVVTSRPGMAPWRRLLAVHHAIHLSKPQALQLATPDSEQRRARDCLGRRPEVRLHGP